MTKKFSPLVFALSAMLALGGLLSPASAVSVDDANILNGGTAAASSAFGVANQIDIPGHVTDGEHFAFVFDDSDTNPSLSISGFNSGIDTLRFFDTPSYGQRIAVGVEVFHSATSQNSLDPVDYASAGSFVLPAVDADVPPNGSLDRYTMATDPNNMSNFPNPDDPAANPNAQISFAELSGLAIPDGTQSLLFLFEESVVGQGLGLTEIQAYAIPEPTGMIALMLGAFSLMVLRRRS